MNGKVVQSEGRKWFAPAEAAIPLSIVFKTTTRSDKSFNTHDYFAKHHYTLGNSARSLLYLVLKKLSLAGLAKGRDEVLIPGYTCYSVAAAVVKAGLKIAVYDIDPKSLNPDRSSVKSRVSEKTLAIISQHLFGIPSETKFLQKMAHAHGAVHIEDAAQAMGGKDHIGILGTKGDYGLYSLGRGKPLPLGTGGILLSPKSNDLIAFSERRANFGIMALAKTAMTEIFSRPSLYRLVEALPLGLGETHFDPGFRLNQMPVLIKSLFIRSMPLLEVLNSHRRIIAGEYRMNLPAKALINEPCDSKCVYTRFPFLASSVRIAETLKPLGVRQMYPKCLIDEKKVSAFISQDSKDTPGARELANRLITLPTHSRISIEIAGHISGALQKCVG